VRLHYYVKLGKFTIWTGASKVTGDFYTSGGEREFTREGSRYADEEIQAGADRNAVAGSFLLSFVVSVSHPSLALIVDEGRKGEETLGINIPERIFPIISAFSHLSFAFSFAQTCCGPSGGGELPPGALLFEWARRTVQCRKRPGQARTQYFWSRTGTRIPGQLNEEVCEFISGEQPRSI
jgi:hypothetical protein